MLGTVLGIKGAMDTILNKMGGEMEEGLDFVSERREKKMGVDQNYSLNNF